VGASQAFFGFEWPDFRDEAEGHPVVARFLAALERLGFERLGVRWEAPPGWERSRSIELSSKGHECFASCAVFEGAPSLHLLTTFDDGTVVVTWFNSGNEALRTRRFVQQNVGNAQAEAMLAVHGREVARQKRKKKLVLDDWTAEGRLVASLHYYANPDNPLVRWALRRRGQRVSTLCDVALMVAWLLALFWVQAPLAALALVAAASVAMGASHWIGVRGVRRRPLAWAATIIAAASLGAATRMFLAQ
jgi:hypothetical protein